MRVVNLLDMRVGFRTLVASYRADLPNAGRATRYNPVTTAPIFGGTPQLNEPPITTGFRRLYNPHHLHRISTTVLHRVGHVPIEPVPLHNRDI